MNDARLRAKIKAVNRANTYAAQLHAQLLPIFQPLLNQKIQKKDNSLLAKIELPALPYRGSVSQGGNMFLHVYRYGSDYRLEWQVKAYEPVEGTGGGHRSQEEETYETSVFLGRIENGVLVELRDQHHGNGQLYGRSDFTFEEIKQKNEALAVAQSAFDVARDALGPFRP